MSYREKGAWIYLIVTVVTYAAYVIVILGRAHGTSVAQVPYVWPMVWTASISVVCSMVAGMAIEIASPSDTRVADARDRDISRFGDRIGGIVLATAMSVPLVLAMVKAQYFWIANSIYAGFVLWALVGTGLKLVAYRRGLSA